MRELPDVIAALHAAVDACDAVGAEWVLIGGLALASHGYVRATDDVDLCLRLERTDAVASQLLDELVAGGFRLDPAAVKRRFERGLNLFRAYWKRVRVDLLLRRPDGYWDGALDHAIVTRRGDLRLRVASAEDLIALKVLAGRPQDLVDVRRLVELGGDLDRTRVLAEIRRLHAIRPEAPLESLLASIPELGPEDPA